MKKLLPYRIILYLIFFLAFALLPLDTIREHSFCVLYLITGLKCAGCGVTRGFTSFMKLDFETAAKFNPVFTYAIFPLCVFLMLQDAVAIIVRAVFKRNCPSILENGMFALKELF